MVMVGYASRTGTRRNLAALRRAGWGLLVSATGVHRTEGFRRYALDNGAWTAHQRGVPWDAEAFVRLIESLGGDADWVVLPDIVAGGGASLDRSLAWLGWCLSRVPRVLLAVQDGMEDASVRPILGSRVGLFVGGSTAWKCPTLAGWGNSARESGCYLHVGRVNSARRIRACQEAGADSFDGTSASRWEKTLGHLDRARRQGVLFPMGADVRP